MRFSKPIQASSEGISPATWRPIFATPPKLDSVSPEARDMNAQKDHFGQLISLVPATFGESAEIVAAFQLCERTHGYPLIAVALNRVTRLLIDARAMLPATLTMLAAQRGYATAGVWVGALVERHIGVEKEWRRFPITEYAPRLGSPYCEFEDIEHGQAIAIALGEFVPDRLQDGNTSPYIALAAALREQQGAKAIEVILRQADVAATTAAPVEAFIRSMAELAKAHGLRLPLDWSRFVEARRRPARKAARRSTATG